MSNIIARESQQLSQDAIITLFELDTTRWGGGVLRFSPSANDGSPISFGGLQYDPFPAMLSDTEISGLGQLPQPTLQVSNLGLEFMSLILGADNLIGAPIKRIRTYRKCLDDGTDPDPNAMFPVEEYIISQKTSQTSETITFKLRVSFDQQGKMIPGRQCMRQCRHRYRWWDSSRKAFRYDGVTCPYADSKYFDANGAPVEDPSMDVCSKQLGTGCKARYGKAAVLPYLGFSTLQRSSS